jgi:hypothetical protein
LSKAGIETTLLVHELPRLLREKNLTASARTGAQEARNIVFPAAFVRDQFCAELGLQRDKGLMTIPQGMYHKIGVSRTAGDDLKKEFGIGNEQRLVIGMGYADLRKGFDMFLQLWRLVRASGDRITHFCWVGDIDPSLKDWMHKEIDDASLTGTFHSPGYRRDVSAFLSAADAFVLTSREDPFPSVVLEALYFGLPVMAFDGSGGIPDLLRGHPLGHVVPFADTVAMAAAVVAAVREHPTDAARSLGEDLIKKKFDFSAYVWRLLRIAQPDLPAISVAVPNFNYAAHMPKRLSSVFLQTHPVKEILVLDDCSSDNSLEAIPVIAAEWGRHIRLLPNRTNSGSVFKQWRKAAESAGSEFLWIAEADDLCSPQFLAEVVALMRHDPMVQFAFSDSAAIDGAGSLLSESYKPYYATVAPGALSRTEIFEAKEFVERFLSIKNLILNVSAVVWRRRALLWAIDACQTDLGSYRMAGDWRLYLQVLTAKGARVGYCSEPLNTHRRHAASVTHVLDPDRHVAEIADCHAFAGSAFELSSEIKHSQSSYLREVSIQLGATPDGLASQSTVTPLKRAS